MGLVVLGTKPKNGRYDSYCTSDTPNCYIMPLALLPELSRARAELQSFTLLRSIGSTTCLRALYRHCSPRLLLKGNAESTTQHSR